MSMTKRYLESLPEAEQTEILGEVDADYEAWWAARESMEDADAGHNSETVCEVK